MLNLKTACTIWLLLFLITSCGESGTNVQSSDIQKTDVLDTSKIVSETDTLGIDSDIDLSQIDTNYRDEFLNSLKEIEDKYGQQWDFCMCVKKNDSINKAIRASNLSDLDLSKLIARFDEVEKRCKAFLVQNPQNTPKERRKHEEKVRSCLEAVTY